MATKVTPVPLVGSPTQRNYNAAASLTSGLDQRYIACQFVPVINNQTGEKIVYVEKRPGLKSFSTPEAGGLGNAISEIYEDFSSGVLVRYFLVNFITGTTSTVYRISMGGAASSVGTITAGTVVKRISFGWFDVLFMTGLITIAGSGSPGARNLFYYPVPGAPTSVSTPTSGVDGPVGNAVEVNGRAFYISWRSGRIFQSALNDVTAWNSAEWIRPSKYQGTGVSLERFGKYIAAFTATGVSFFYIGQRPQGSILNEAQEMAFSLSRNNSYTSSALSNYPLITASLGDAIFWCYADFAGGVWMMDGGGPRKISGPIEDRILSNFTGGETQRISPYIANGQRYLYCFNGANQLLYHIDAGMWTEPNFDIFVAFNSNGFSISSDANDTSGKVFSFGDQSPTYQDNGVAYTMVIQTASLYLNGGHAFEIVDIELSADTQSSGTTTLQYSIDDGTTWVTAGSFDMTQARKQVSGTISVDTMIAFRMSNNANTPFRANNLVIYWNPVGQ